MAKMLELVCLVADLSLCNTDNCKQLSCSFTIQVEIQSPPLLKSRRVSGIYN